MHPYNLENLVITGATIAVLAGSLALHPPAVVAAPGPVHPQLSWQDIFAGLPRRKPPLGSRGELCVLAPLPSQEPSLVLEVRPSFVWQAQGIVGAIGLQKRGESSLLWRQPVRQPDTIPLANGQPPLLRVRYGGKPLQMGQTYDVLLFDAATDTNPKAKYAFQVMPASDRAQTLADLRALTSKLNAAGASVEAIALQRAIYLANKQLWSEVVQTIYSVPHPSRELQQVAQTVPAQLCQLTPSRP